MLKLLLIAIITTFSCIPDAPQAPATEADSAMLVASHKDSLRAAAAENTTEATFLMTEYTINGVHFSLSGSSTVLANGETAWDATLIDQVSWATMQGLIGAVVDDVGTVSALGLRRRDPVPANTAFKLITAPPQ